MAPSEGGFAQSSARVPWREPLDAYRRLRSAGLRPILLDGAGAHPDARWAFVAFLPVREIVVEGDWVSESGPGTSTRTRGSVARHLGVALEAGVRAVEEAAPFTGGWVGYVGYELAPQLDAAFPAGHPRGGLPDAILRLHLGAVAFDRSRRQATVHCADLEGDATAARARLADAVDLLAATAGTAVAPGPTVGAGDWTASLDEAGFRARVDRLRSLIHDGDLFQANLATRFSAPCDADPADLLGRLLDSNPSPYMALLEEPGFSLVSSSPELLFAVSGGRIRSRPIAGTRKRGATEAEDDAMEAELLADPKERAEHTMLVDLVRNDVARVAVPGTVEVPESMSVERYRHVLHLVSRVEADVRPGTGLVDWLGALFPGGTVTGAPKIRAVQRIREAEPVARGPYTGSLGYLSWSGNAAWNILIRTLVLRHGGAETPTATVHAGSGIVADSDAGREWKEARRKAEALLAAASGTAPAGRAARLGEVARHGSWAPPRPTASFPGARILLVDNEDSFVHNLADYGAALGAAVRVVRNDADWRREMEGFAPTHVILSPGPGWPRDAGCTPEVARELTGRLPLLGVCLGHQAIAEAHGARVHVLGPVHGKPADVLHEGEGILAGLPSPLRAARYHSLAVDASTLPPEWRVTARLADGTPMAIQHRTHPTFGVQFHPESLCTEGGLELLANFLRETP